MIEKTVEIALPVALILVMIGVGMSLQIADFKRVAKCPKAFFIGAFCQLLFIPLLAYAVILAFGLSGTLAMGVLVISLCPGGVTSNLFTYLAKGDVGLSVSLTAVIGIITPFTIPFVVNWGFEWQGLGNEDFVLPVPETVKKLLIISVLPIAVGMTVRCWAKDHIERIEGLVRTGSSAVLALVIIVLYLKLGVSKVNEFAVLAGPACVVMNLAGMTLGFTVASLAKLKPSQRTCIMLEVGLQNGTIALLVTMTIMKSLEMSIAPSIYSLWMMAPATLVVLISKKRHAAEQ